MSKYSQTSGISPKSYRHKLTTRLTAGLAVALVAIAIPASPALAASATLTIGVVAPFTGADAALGPKYQVACLAATQQINAIGGILGQKFTCKTSDTRGDPADAVPAVRQLYATTKNLAFVIGCTSDEASTVVPVFGANTTVSFCMTGESEFDSVKFPYFFRLVPPDAADAVAMVAIAKTNGYKSVALAFGNDAGSQTFVAPGLSALSKAGIKVVSNQTLDMNAGTFQTEAQAIVSAKPDAILMEALGSAGVALLKEIYQLNGNKMIPTIGTSAMIDPVFYGGVTAAGAIPVNDFNANFWADNQVATSKTKAQPLFTKSVLAQKGKFPGATTKYLNTLLSANGTVHLYDGINLAALAMAMSGSTKGSVFKADILKIANGVKGAVLVNSVAEGVKALKAHKKIRYQGVGGLYKFDAYQTAFGAFESDQFTSSGSTKSVGIVNAALLASLSK